MIFLKRFKKKVASAFTEHTDRTDIIIINRLCHGYNTNLLRIKNIKPYVMFDLKYLKYGPSMLWIQLCGFSPHQLFIRYFNIMLPIGEISSDGYYLSRYFALCIKGDYILDKTEIEYRYKTKEIKCDLFGKSYKIEKTNITEFMIPCKIVINYIKN